MKRFVSCALLISLILCCCCSCGSKQNEQNSELTQYSVNFINYFDTVSTVIGFAKSEEEFHEVTDFIDVELKEYNKLYDIYKSYEGVNNIRTINDKAGVEPVKVDNRIIELLEYCKELYTITGGKTNVAMGSVLSIWHHYRDMYSDDSSAAKLPDISYLKAAAQHTDINNVIIDKENSTVFLADKEMSLDVGAVAKGYATEQIAKALEAKGINYYALNIGGNIRTIGTKADGNPWKTAVTKSDTPQNGGKQVKVNLSSSAFVTSGTYQRYYTVNGVQYHHIIDPETLMPKFDFISVSICCKDSGLADALSTATFNMTLEEGQTLINGFDGVEAMWITADGDIHYSNGFNKILAED